MAFSTVAIVDYVAIVFSLIELGLTASLVSLYYDAYYSFDRLNFMLFNSIWSLLVLAYVAFSPIYMSNFFNRMISFALVAISSIFWFAGSIALAVVVTPAACPAGLTWCSTSKAAVAFGFFLWALFTALAVLDGLAVMRSRGNAPTKREHSHHGQQTA